MSRTRQPLAHLATLTVALLSFAPLAGHDAAASVPPPSDPPPVAEDAPETSESVSEIVQSWTLTPGGSADGDEAGSRPNLSYQIDPGAVIDDTVIVYNFSNVEMDFDLYATDAFNNVDGAFDLLTGDEVPVDAGSWVSLGQGSIVLAPGKQATIPITITVPADATPGDHVGAIVASSVAVSDNGNGQVVNVDRRTGTRLYIQVSGPLTRELAVTDVQTTYRHALSPLGSADVTFRVENRGNMRLGGRPDVSIAGPFGLGRRTVTLPDLIELLPGESVSLSATLDDVGAMFVDSTTVRISPVESEDSVEVATAIGKVRSFTPPVSVLIAMLVLSLAVMTRRRYRRHRDQAGITTESDVAEEHERTLEPQVR